MLYRKHIKRILDWLLAALALVVLSPLFLVLVAAIRIDSPGNAIFKQERAGYHKKSFTVYKFRTMYIDAPDNMASSDLEDPYKYITGIGIFLRKTSLDELPQLWNILRGEMSLVGPRPLIWAESDVIEARDALGVYAVRPGLTGWAQVNGRDFVEGNQKGELDAEYVEKMSFWFDLMCIFKTVAVVFRADGFHEGIVITEEKKAASEQIDSVLPIIEASETEEKKDKMLRSLK